ncbi:MAG: hypothetical protein KC457_32610, partial [Myxococcales bacterium]|nr:hypothetical protein [Myxococcales bacterium]
GSPTLLALAPDGRRVALAGLTGKTAGIWDLTTGRRLIEYPLSGDDISALAYSPKGERLAVATAAGIELWSTLVLDLQAGQTISIFVDGFNGSGSFQLAINQL